MIRALEEKEHDCFIQISFFSEIQRVALRSLVSHFVLLDEFILNTYDNRMMHVLLEGIVFLKNLIIF
jgi:hypothetical protein